MHRFPLLIAALLLICSPASRAHDAPKHMDDAARLWLASLTPELRAKATYAFADAERVDWHFIPRDRRGVSLKEMTPRQRYLAHALVTTALSSHGYGKTLGVMTLESVLADIEGRPEHRDAEKYYVTIFGEPGKEPWGWRYEGHHVAINITRAGGSQTVTTPQFFGSNPAMVRTGPLAGMRVLAAEEDLGRALAKSLNAEQLKKAVILKEVPADIFNVPGRNVTKPEGIAWSQLDASQRELLLSLVREYTGRFHGPQADAAMKRLTDAGLDTLHFAWVGTLDVGKPHYYRVQSGSFVLEYDNIQNDANHVHSLWRDFDREFGADLLGAHVKAAH